MNKTKNKLSLEPQKRKSTADLWWYYENKGSIDVIVKAKEIGVVEIRIPKAMLKKSLERME